MCRYALTSRYREDLSYDARVPKRCRNCNVALIERIDLCGRCLSRWLLRVVAFALAAFVVIVFFVSVGIRVERRLPHQERTRHPLHGSVRRS
jgi:hypothetical protein